MTKGHGWDVMRHWLAALALSCVCAPGAAVEPSLRPPPAGSAIVIVEPDVELAIMIASGATQPRPAWSDAARANIAAAAREALAAKQHPVHPLPRADASDRVRQILLLHDAVRVSMRTADESERDLRTLPRDRAWTLGAGARVLDETGVATHALLIHCDGDFTGGPRVFFVVLGAAMGFLAETGLQRASATLVDLDTGDIVWRNRIVARPDQDVRTAAGARSLVGVLLQGAPL